MLQIPFRCLPSKGYYIGKVPVQREGTACLTLCACINLFRLSQISVPLYQQPFAQQSFASSSDTNSEIDQALAKATESHDAHKLLQVRFAREQAQQLV